MGGPEKKTNWQVLDDMWEKIDQLRGSKKTSDYFEKFILRLLFLKYLNDKFEEKRRELQQDPIKARHVDKRPFYYTSDGVIYLPEEARWKEIQKRAEEGNILVCLDEAFQSIEQANSETFKGVLKRDPFVGLAEALDSSNVKKAMDIIENADNNEEEDFLGKAYQFFLDKLSSFGSGSEDGEFYTPPTIVKLIVSLIEPFKGRIYDPCCGSGGMFIQAKEMVKSIKSKEYGFSAEQISILGQEKNDTTHRICKMNLVMRGIIDAKLGEPKCSFKNDQHPNEKVDYIMANPPFNQKNWRSGEELQNDHRWKGWDVPPSSNANYAWILHMLDKLSQNGVAAFLLANKSLDASGVEEKIRKKLLESDLIEAIIALPRGTFYNTDIAVVLWVINRNKKNRELKLGNAKRELRDRSGEILFIDGKDLGIIVEKNYKELSEQNIEQITKIFHSWRYLDYPEKYENQDGFCRSVTIEEIKEKSSNCSFFPNEYIPFKDREENIDWIKRKDNLKEKLIQSFKEESLLREEIERSIFKGE